MSEYSDVETALLSRNREGIAIDWLADPTDKEQRRAYITDNLRSKRHRGEQVCFADELAETSEDTTMTNESDSTIGDEPPPSLKCVQSRTIGNNDGVFNLNSVATGKNDWQRSAFRKSTVYHQSILELFSGTRSASQGYSATGGERVFQQARFLFPLLISLLLLFGVAFLLPAGILTKHGQGLDLFKQPSTNLLFAQLMAALSSISVMLFLSWGAGQITKNVLLSDTDSAVRNIGSLSIASGCCKALKLLIPGRTRFLLSLTISIRHVLLVVKVSVRDEFLSETMLLMNTGVAFSLFALWISILDDFVVLGHLYASKMDTIAEKSPKSDKVRSMMQVMATFENPKLDCGYAIPGGRRSPARVLAELVGVYCTIVKVAGLVLLFLYVVGVNLYTNLIIISMSLFLTGSVAALNIDGALSNLIPLALGNTFHIGEIVSIAQTGSTPGDSPVDSLCGFVEGVTWGHVVIRDFRRKQVFIPHSDMRQMTVSNWSRRPSKICRITMTVEPGLSKGAASLAMLGKFTMDWIKLHPKIDQDLFQKAAVKMTEEGDPLLEIIFYPEVGIKLGPIRAEIIVMLMDAAQRLDICLMPAERRPTLSWGTVENRAATEDEIDLSELLPSSKLTYRAGYKPKTE